jgi:hypothetical protein
MISPPIITSLAAEGFQHGLRARKTSSLVVAEEKIAKRQERSVPGTYRRRVFHGDLDSWIAPSS